MTLIECELARILISERSEAQVIVLREKGGERTLPIEIGIVEAMAIDREIKGVELMRPMTHDLLVAVVDAFGGRLSRIVVNDLVTLADGMGTFYGLLVFEQGDHEIEVDTRPSDAIALAVRTGCSIFVAEHVLDKIAEE